MPRAFVVAIGLAASLLLQGCLKRPKKCSKESENCKATGCCFNTKLTCYARDEHWASCHESCTPSPYNLCEAIDAGSMHHTPVQAVAVKPAGSTAHSPSSSPSRSSFHFSSPAPAPPPPPPPPPVQWIEGTWTSAYWDCCKPTCSQKGKGDVDYPPTACSAESGERLSDTDEASVCDGGESGMCASYAPFEVNVNVSMGFAAVAGSGKHGLEGDSNCGQCFELKFTGEEHKEKDEDAWGGAHPSLTNKRIIVQVVSVNFETDGDHSFDLLVPGAGQNGYESGCTTMFPKFSTDDFDCGQRFGGCAHNSSCAKMPAHLQKGCTWHHTWYRWLSDWGKTNSPFVKFRRVQCPGRLTTISGSTPGDDFDFPVPDTSASFTG